MDDSIVIDRNGNFYDLSQYPIIFSSQAYPSGDFDGYLSHKSFKIWQIDDNLYYEIMYDEGARVKWFFKAEGNGEPSYSRKWLEMFINKHAVFNNLCKFMPPSSATALSRNWYE